MPSVTHQPVAGVLAAAAGTDVYTAPVGQKFKPLACTVTNVDSVARTFTLYRIAAAGAVDNASMLVKARNLGPGDTVIVSELVQHVVEAGGRIHVVASADSAIAINLSGLLLVEDR